MTPKNWSPSCLHRRLDGFAPGHKALEWWLPHQFHLHWSRPRMCRFTSFQEAEFGAWHNELAWVVCRGGPSVAVPSSSFWFAVCRGPAHPSTPASFPYKSHRMHFLILRIVGLHALLPYPQLSATRRRKPPSPWNPPFQSQNHSTLLFFRESRCGNILVTGYSLL